MSSPQPLRRPAQKVLLIGWDAADWRMIDPLVEQGLMPHMKRFIEGGAIGNVGSLTPMLSPILWTSIATGKHADKHDILGFAEPDGTTGKIRPVTSTSRKCKALWNILSDRGLEAGVLNWFASHPAEPIDGFVVTDRFPHPSGPPNQPWTKIAGSVHPETLLDELCALRVHPAHTTPQQLLPFIPLLGELDPEKDENLQHLRMLLAHCASVHAAATHLMQTREWDFLGVYYDTIDRVGHAFMEYHPPRRPDVDEEDFRRYRDVMTGCYRFHDMMLGRLMELAGEDTTVIILSDHGFYSDELRPEGTSKIKDGQPVAWHRRYGILAVHGPHVKPDSRVYGASLLDIAPTILAMLGLPVADDMDGTALTQMFDTPVVVETVPTYEDGTVYEPAAPEDDPWVAQQMIEQLAALGYVDAGGIDGVLEDRLRNLGQVYLATGRPRLAIEQFEQVLERKPDDAASRMGMASGHLQMGELDACESAVRAALEGDEDRPEAHLYLGIIHFRRGDDDRALEHLLRAERTQPNLSGLQVQIGQVHLRRESWDDAERTFRTALAHDPDNAEAYDGLGVVFRHRNQPARAVQQHMEAIGRLHNRPQSHVNLGLSLARLGRIPWAIRAFETALEMSPDHPVPHQALAQLFARNNLDPDRAAHHGSRAEEILARLGDRGPATGSSRADDKESDR